MGRQRPIVRRRTSRGHWALKCIQRCDNDNIRALIQRSFGSIDHDGVCGPTQHFAVFVSALIVMATTGFHEYMWHVAAIFFYYY